MYAYYAFMVFIYSKQMIRKIYGCLFLVEQLCGIPNGYLVGTKKELKYLYVLPSWRNQRIATKLVEEYIKYANKDFYVLVLVNDLRAITFYKELGFRKVGKAITSKGETKRIVMRKVFKD